MKVKNKQFLKKNIVLMPMLKIIALVYQNECRVENQLSISYFPILFLYAEYKTYFATL